MVLFDAGFVFRTTVTLIYMKWLTQNVGSRSGSIMHTLTCGMGNVCSVMTMPRIILGLKRTRITNIAGRMTGFLQQRNLLWHKS